jgi:hypothetical protein
MSRFTAFLGPAVVLALSLAGCTTTDFLAVETRPRAGEAPKDRILPAPPITVYAYAQAALHEKNVMWQSSQEGQAIRLACLPDSHTQFSLMLTPWPIQRTVQTRIHVGWDHAPEPENGLTHPVVVQILDLIEAKCRQDRERSQADGSPSARALSSPNSR